MFSPLKKLLFNPWTTELLIQYPDSNTVISYLSKKKTFFFFVNHPHGFIDQLLYCCIFQVCKEKHRFERLMDYFRCEEGNIDYMVRESFVSWICRMSIYPSKWKIFGLKSVCICGPGRLHAVHQHRGPLGGGHELQSPSAVWIYQAGTGWLPGGDVTTLLLTTQTNTFSGGD